MNKLNNEQIDKVSGGSKTEEDIFNYEQYFEAGIVLTKHTIGANTYTIMCGKNADGTYDYMADITKACAQAIRTKYSRILTKDEFLSEFSSGIIQ